jgi:hypothetical protein
MPLPLTLWKNYNQQKAEENQLHLTSKKFPKKKRGMILIFIHVIIEIFLIDSYRIE